ncbi:IS3 family transposase [Streptomyces sp. NPDC056237]|uniref:IS3 family transposase n=1 Tax=unclassified Streptomyces TaxID=2593676 RepID=UPI0035E0C71A
MRDTELKERISEAFQANYRVYGARKIWRELNGQGHRVARCTVESLMRELGIALTSSPAHRQVPRRHWIKRDCPSCRSAAGKECLDSDGQGTWSWRPFPHDERLQLTIEERQARVTPNKQVTQETRTNREATIHERPARGRRRGKRKTRTNREAKPARSASWQVTDIACPDCGAAAGKGCKTPSGHSHQTRIGQFRRRFPSA